MAKLHKIDGFKKIALFDMSHHQDRDYKALLEVETDDGRLMSMKLKDNSDNTLHRIFYDIVENGEPSIPFVYNHDEHGVLRNKPTSVDAR